MPYRDYVYVCLYLRWMTSAAFQPFSVRPNKGKFKRKVFVTGMCGSCNAYTYRHTLKFTHTHTAHLKTLTLPWVSCFRWGRPFGVDSSLTKVSCTWPSITCCFPAVPHASNLASYLLLTLEKNQEPAGFSTSMYSNSEFFILFLWHSYNHENL